MAILKSILYVIQLGANGSFLAKPQLDETEDIRELCFTITTASNIWTC